jgi:Uma2 family endonuclease
MIQTLTTSDHPKPFVWTRDAYQQLGDLGIFADRRVELIEGQVLQMSPMRPKHTTAVALAEKILIRAFGDGRYVREQSPLSLGSHSQPEPDIAVVNGVIRDYSNKHPAHALLVVEISESTLAFDRTTKAKIYADAGIEDYWIVNLVDNCLEVQRQPVPGDGYAQKLTLKPGEKIAPLSAPQAMIGVEELLP